MRCYLVHTSLFTFSCIQIEKVVKFEKRPIISCDASMSHTLRYFSPHNTYFVHLVEVGSFEFYVCTDWHSVYAFQINSSAVFAIILCMLVTMATFSVIATMIRPMQDNVNNYERNLTAAVFCCCCCADIIATTVLDH